MTARDEDQRYAFSGTRVVEACQARVERLERERDEAGAKAMEAQAALAGEVHVRAQAALDAGLGESERSWYLRGEPDPSTRMTVQIELPATLVWDATQAQRVLVRLEDELKRAKMDLALYRETETDPIELTAYDAGRLMMELEEHQ